MLHLSHYLSFLETFFKKTEPTTKPTGLESLDVLVKAVAQQYPNDPSKPGVTISLLQPGEYYASVVRYGEKYGKNKWTVRSAVGTSVEAAVETLFDVWSKRTDEGKEEYDPKDDFFDDYMEEDKKWGGD
jgi:hypothetical protein